jgi:adenylate kinase family enzyme
MDKIIILGPQASGKTTLARMLEEKGYRLNDDGPTLPEIKMLMTRTGKDVIVSSRFERKDFKRFRGNILFIELSFG